MKVCNFQVAVDNLASGVEQPQSLVVIFQAGGQGQLHVSAQAHCNTDSTRSKLHPACTCTMQNLFYCSTFMLLMLFFTVIQSNSVSVQ